MNSVVVGNPCFRKHSIEIIPPEDLLELPEKTYKMNRKKTPGERRKSIAKSYSVVMDQKTVIKP